MKIAAGYTRTLASLFVTWGRAFYGRQPVPGQYPDSRREAGRIKSSKSSGTEPGERERESSALHQVTRQECVFSCFRIASAPAPAPLFFSSYQVLCASIGCLSATQRRNHIQPYNPITASLSCPHQLGRVRHVFRRRVIIHISHVAPKPGDSLRYITFNPAAPTATTTTTTRTITTTITTINW